MPNVLDRLYWFENDQSDQPTLSDELVDVDDGDAVLHFTYRYLEARSLPPSDREVLNVTMTIARYQGPRLVRWSTLESMLAGLRTAPAGAMGAETVNPMSAA